VFNALHSLDAVVDAAMLDLFAGSGGLGIEALSRGARHCTFVDTARPALQAIRANLDSTGLAGRARVVAADATAFLRGNDRQFDVALLDPPYAFEEWDDVLATVPAGLIVIESNRAIALPREWIDLRLRRYGSTVVVFARRASHSE
jgi:16S rRNA (guanine966-N2)-methyltransferase